MGDTKTYMELSVTNGFTGTYHAAGKVLHFTLRKVKSKTGQMVFVGIDSRKKRSIFMKAHIADDNEILGISIQFSRGSAPLHFAAETLTEENSSDELERP